MKTRFEGPAYGKAASALLTRALLVLSPVLVLAGSLAFFAATGAVHKDVMFLAVFLGGVSLVIGIVLPLALPDDMARARRKRHVALREHAGVDSALEGLAWSGNLLGEGLRYRGSLHVVGRKLYFLAHQTALRPEFGKETVLELDLAQVAAVEVGPARSFPEWFSAGPGLVQLLLVDGRTIRFGTSDAESLATVLRDVTRRPDGTPVVVAGEDVDARARSLAAGARAAAVIIVRDGAPPYVLLEGSNETLRGGLEQALDVLRAEKRGLEPFIAARERAP